LRVLDSLEGTDLPLARAQQERRSLEELIHARTRELNQINTAWTKRLAWSSAPTPSRDAGEARQAGARTDYYLLRLISEHPVPTQKLWQKLGRHPTVLSAKSSSPSQR